ncbi:MAG: MobF family relaxase [Opitutales bacterium]|jgi:conjugative relaxase-like TrwC/TraI family protein
MFTIKPQVNRAVATSYFDEHFSCNDYYSQGETKAGRWFGNAAPRLGLKAGEVVSREVFFKLCDNRHPVTGQQLTPLQLANRRIFFDFTCSAPKSVSILAVTFNDQRIVAAHQEAAVLAMGELEQFVKTRIRKDGIQDQDRTTGSLVAASFLHNTSRALDPQLHTHFCAFNATFDEVESRWKAIQPRTLYDASQYATAVYRHTLTRRLHELGYGTRSTAKGSFEIEGVESSIIERFSKRSEQRDAAIAKEEKRLGRRLSRNEISHVVHQSRPRKLKEASEAQVRDRQLVQLYPSERMGLQRLVTAATASTTPMPHPEAVAAPQAVDYALNHAYSRVSVVPRHRLLQEALIRGRGTVDLPQLKAALEADPRLVRVGEEFSTHELLGKECFLIGAVDAGSGAAAPLAPRFAPPPGLAPDQAKALRHVLTSRDWCTGLRGLAGSGKTTALQSFHAAVTGAGYAPVYCAPGTAARDVLRQDGLAAETLKRVILDVGRGKRSLSEKNVLVLDEAGTADLDDMVQLFELAQARGVRLVLSGDTGQHASVGRGDPLRLLEEHSEYRFGELTAIRRQQPAAYREAVELAATKQSGEALDKLDGLGAVTEALTEEGKLYELAADAYLAASKSGRSALLVSPTWREIEAVTQRVRGKLRDAGTLGKVEERVTVFDSESWTEAQRGHAGQYTPDLHLRFVKATKDFKKGDCAAVAAVRPDGLLLRHRGRLVEFNPARAAACFDVGQAHELPVAAGDWLLLQANQDELVNGERVQVKQIEHGRITLADGRVLPRNYNAFTHGYAVTSHSSQGKTVDEVLLVASSQSFPAVSREQFYVSISRGREQCRIFTDDKEGLRERVELSRQRKAAVELAPEWKEIYAALSQRGYKPIPKSEPEVKPPPPLEEKTFSPPAVPAPRWRVGRPSRLHLVQQHLAALAASSLRWLGLPEAANPFAPPSPAEMAAAANFEPESHPFAPPSREEMARQVREMDDIIRAQEQQKKLPRGPSLGM